MTNDEMQSLFAAITTASNPTEILAALEAAAQKCDFDEWQQLSEQIDRHVGIIASFYAQHGQPDEKADALADFHPKGSPRLAIGGRGLFVCLGRPNHCIRLL